MKTKNYLILCASITIVWVISLLYVPGFADAVELVMLIFLAVVA